MRAIKQFSIFLDPYYWKSAALIASSGLARQYRNSYLGLLWTLLQPMSMLVVYAFVMPMLIKFPVKDYALYILCTMPMWSYFSTSLILAHQSLLSQAETLKRCIISSTIFPVADVLKQTYTYAAAFTAMYLLALLLGFPGSWYALLLPIYLLPVILALMALGVGVAFISPYVRDIGEVILVGMNIMSWLSAVPYPIELLPQKLQDIMVWNPFYILMQPTVSLIYHHELPSGMAVAKLLGVVLISVAFGYTLYRKCRHNFVYYL